MEVNQTLHDVWRSPGLVLPDRLCPNQGPTHIMGWYSIYTFWELLPPNGILPGAKLTLRPSLYWHRYCTTFEQWASVELCGMGQGNSAGWPSRGTYMPHNKYELS